MKKKNIFNKIIGFIIIILLCAFWGLLSYFQSKPLIATHPDMDHIADLDKLILAFDAECIYMTITTKSNKEMNELYQVMENRKT